MGHKSTQNVVDPIYERNYKLVDRRLPNIIISKRDSNVSSRNLIN